MSATVARGRQRRKLFQPAELEAAGETRRVHLLDLSETGCQASCPAPPAPGGFVAIACGEWRRSGRVAWVRERRFGVTFVKPLTMAEMDAALSLGARLA